MRRKSDEQAQRLAALLLDLAGQPHQWLSQFVERLAAARAPKDVAKLQELLELAADSVLGCQEVPGDLLRRAGVLARAQILDDLPLLRREPRASVPGNKVSARRPFFRTVRTARRATPW